MKVLSEKEFKDNFDYYSNLVFEEKEMLMIKRKNGSTVYLKPVYENEIR